MKTALYGRMFFGATAVFYGIVLLVWHDMGAWEGMPIPKLPFGDAIADLVAIALILGGILMMLPRAAHLGSIVSGVVFIIFSLAALPPVIADPLHFPPYIGFFEIFSLVWGALALYATTGPDTARSVEFGRISRQALGVCTVSFTAAQWYYLKYTASLVPTWIPQLRCFGRYSRRLLSGLQRLRCSLTCRRVLRCT